MKRLHLFEFEDQSWLPASLRNAMTLYLASTYKMAPFPKLWADLLAKVVRASGASAIVDLGSGGAGPLPLVARELEALNCRVAITLTDLYPNPMAASSRNSNLAYWPKPVDARSVPAELPGVRTMFASFHHFDTGDARKILTDAMASRNPICVFEATSRTPASIAASLLIPLFVLLLTPTVRPFTFFQFFFTYLIPVMPLLIFWDGLVSQLRTMTPEELEAMTRDLCAPDYEWTVGLLRAPGLPFGVPYVIGAPK